MRKCRNWQTSKTKDLVIIAIVWVQVPSSALKTRNRFIESVPFYFGDEMVSRVELFGQLSNIIEKSDNQEYRFYGFSRKKCHWTSINADYLINSHERFENLMLYKKEEDQAGIIFICEMSIFSSEASMNDYTSGQTQYTVLKVEKCNKVSGTMIPIFTHKNYVEK